MEKQTYKFKIGFKDSIKKAYEYSLVHGGKSIDAFPYTLQELIATLANKTSYDNLYIKIVRTKDVKEVQDESKN